MRERTLRTWSLLPFHSPPSLPNERCLSLSLHVSYPQEMKKTRKEMLSTIFIHYADSSLVITRRNDLSFKNEMRALPFCFPSDIFSSVSPALFRPCLHWQKDLWLFEEGKRANLFLTLEQDLTFLSDISFHHHTFVSLVKRLQIGYNP